MLFPSAEKIGRWAKERVIDQCRVSNGARQQLARNINTWRWTGSDSGAQAIFNRLETHCDRLASAVYSPADVRYQIEFENDYGIDMTDRAQVASRYLTREIAQRNLDLGFQEAVEEAVPFGCTILKHIWTHHGPDVTTLMPWQFGVYLENETDIDKQEAMCETTYLLPEEVWRRISHRSDARELMRRIMSRSQRTSADDVPPGFMHQLLMAGTPPLIQDSGASASPGGMISLTGTPASAMLAADIQEGLIEAHQCWVVNDETGDYTTIQLIEPDILIAPRMIRSNLFFPHEHPFSVVRVNPQRHYFWGRSELAPLIKLQSLLRDRGEDIKKIMGLQYDRIRAFIGFDGMNDEKFDQLQQEGWLAEPNPNSKVEDLTPPLPANAFDELKMIMGFFDEIAGFDNALSGKGEPGVRSANHFQGLVRQASPRLRDRAIRVERQCAEFGEKVLWHMAAKDGRTHWTKSDDPKFQTDFILAQLPDDARVLVDSHSSSPIYQEDHANTAAFLLKSGAIDAEDLLDLLPVPNRDLLKEKLRKRELSKKALLDSLPPELKMQALVPNAKPQSHGRHH
jgi:hypothetical protein